MANARAIPHALGWPQDAKTVTDPTTGQTVIVGPGGYPAQSILSGNRAKIRYTNVATFGTTGANITFNQRWLSPFKGRAEVRFIVELGNTAAAVTPGAFAVSAGRDGTEVNPKTALGADASWVSAALTVAQADADYLTNGKVGRGFSDWVELDIPEGGAIYSRILFSANAAGQVGSGARLVSDWENYLNSRYPGMRYWANHQAGNYIASNQSAMPNGTLKSEYAPVVGIEIRPLNSGAVTIDGVGDSTSQELAVGTRGNPDFKPFNSSWIAEVVSRRRQAGLPWTFANHAYEGKTAEFFLGRYLDLCTNNIDATGELAIIQPFSVNGSGFADAIIDANLDLVKQIASLRRAAGKFTVIRTVFPVKGQSGSQLTAWTRGNRLVRQLDLPVMDVANLTLVQPDNTHLNQDDQYIVADFADRYLTSIRI